MHCNLDDFSIKTNLESEATKIQTMQVIDKNTISEIISKESPNALIECIETAFVEYSNGNAVVPPVGTLTFDQPPGDVHIKYGYITSGSHYVIKIASGFYDNPSLGLSSSNGMNLVFNKENGLAEAILLDEGYLTDVRTALAGAVVTKHLQPTEIRRVGIIGTGIQARLQLRYLSYVTDCRSVMVWGRNRQKVHTYEEEMKAEGWEISIAGDPSQIALDCDIIVTTTPSNDPILPFISGQRDMLVTAMGADTVGKQEIDPLYIQNAALLAMDSTSQCTHHGEIHKSMSGGLKMDERFIEVGSIINNNRFKRPSGLIVADLTGIATQDLQISSFVLNHLQNR